VSVKPANHGDLEPATWGRVKEVFLEALDREPPLRPAFVSDRCAGDPALQKTVEGLLAAHDEAGEFLETPTEFARLAGGFFGRGEATRALSIGDRVGPYEIVALLEAGGMGEVYRARDVRLGREVAVKVLLPHLSRDPDRLRRFESEARTVGAINDPNIVTVFDVGWDQEKPYLVSELLEGETLGNRLRRGRLGVRESAGVAAQIAHGLAAAHEKGIVHRDLKPDNVFLTRQGPVKLLDFGVAKLIDGAPDAPSGAPLGTGAGRSTLMGTPGYIAPEQLEGHAVDHRADIFALGALLYRMLTGRSAFAEETTVEGLRATVTKEPHPFALTDGVPETLQRIVRRCLEKRPQDRFPTALQARVALQRFEASLEEGSAELGPPFPFGWRAWLGGMGVAAALLFGLLGWQRAMSPSEKDEAPLPVANTLAVLPIENLTAGADPGYFVDGMTEALITELGRTHAKGLRVISRASVMSFKGRTKGLADVGRELGADTVVRGTLRRAGSEVKLAVQLDQVSTGQRLWSGSYEGRVSEIGALHREVAAAIATALTPSAPPSVVPPGRREPQSVEAYDAYLRGRYYWNLRSEEGVTQAIGQFNHALELDPLYAQAYTGLADALVTLGDMLYLMPSEDAFAKAEAASLRALTLDPSQAEAHATLGHLRTHAWRWTEAEAEFQSALTLNPDYATAHHWRAYNLASIGRGDDAIRSIERAQALDPLSPIINTDHAQILFFTGHSEEAVAQCRKTLQMNPEFAEARRILFLALQRTHHDEEALRELRIYHRLSSGGPGASVGWGYAILGRPADARSVIAELQRKPQKRFAPRYDLAVIHAGLGEVDRAFALLDEAVTTRDPESMILPVDPRLENLRGDPRFAALLRRMGLPLP